MSLSPGTRLGSYEVTAQIGVGGMGEVSQRLATGVDWLTGLAWSSDGHIVFGRNNQLWRVPTAGGDGERAPVCRCLWTDSGWPGG